MALELRIENERWRDVPIYVRAGKHLRATVTELRFVLRPRPALGFLTARRPPGPNELVLRIDPHSGLRLVLEDHRADAPGPQPVELDLEFAREGGEAPTPYEVLFRAALAGDPSVFTHQDTVEETWRIVQPLLDHPGRIHPYRKGSWGPAAAHELPADHGGWRSPWTAASVP